MKYSKLNRNTLRINLSILIIAVITILHGCIQLSTLSRHKISAVVLEFWEFYNRESTIENLIELPRVNFYNEKGILIEKDSIIKIDCKGNIIEKRDYYFNGKNYIKLYRYDEQNRIVEEISFADGEFDTSKIIRQYDIMGYIDHEVHFNNNALNWEGWDFKIANLKIEFNNVQNSPVVIYTLFDNRFRKIKELAFYSEIDFYYTDYKYNKSGKLFYINNKFNNSFYSNTFLNYDKRGNLVNRIYYEYQENDTLIEKDSFQYDNRDSLVEHRVYDYQGNLERFYKYKFNSRGLKIMSLLYNRYPHWGGYISGNLYNYDDNNNLIEHFTFDDLVIPRFNIVCKIIYFKKVHLNIKPFNVEFINDYHLM